MAKLQMDTLRPLRNLITQRYTTPNPPHKHVHWELIIFENGITENKVNDIVYENTGRGDVFLLGPNHIHSIRFLTEPNTHWDIYCSEEDLKSICNLLDENLFEQACATPPICFKLPLRLVDSVFSELSELEVLCSLTELNDIKTTQTHQRFANSILHYILGLYMKEEWCKNDKIPRWFYDIVHELQKPETFSKRISDVVNMSNYSHAQFSKIFKKFTNMSLIDYIVNLRLDYAAQLLRTTNTSALEISSFVGYDSFSFFIKIFKKRYGVTPLQFRKLPDFLPPKT